MDSHPFDQRYKMIWEKTRQNGDLSADQVEKSRFYFNFDKTSGAPVPKVFDTYGVVALMPMSAETQTTLTHTWDYILKNLQQPLAYAVEPDKRHVELILFSRPEETFPEAAIHRAVDKSYESLRANPPHKFRAVFCHPFITPDGTVVIPGYPEPATAIDDFRTSVRMAVGENIPNRQSQWFHISLGRILEPLSSERMLSAFDDMQENWGKPLAELLIDKVMWTHEQQWYMLQKTILHELELAA